jgi:hypothetical protein
VKCEVEYHVGLTCDAYQALLQWKKDEGATMHNIGKFALLEVRKLRLLQWCDPLFSLSLKETLVSNHVLHANK